MQNGTDSGRMEIELGAGSVAQTAGGDSLPNGALSCCWVLRGAVGHMLCLDRALRGLPCSTHPGGLSV